MRPLSRFFLIMTAMLGSLGASYRTPNFIVEAPEEQLAKKIGDKAEAYRKELALQWLGEEMPTWGRRCPIEATMTLNGSNGASEFVFDNGSILSMKMHIEGNQDCLLASVLPHEVTHTILAYHFRAPLPRWADEGGSILSEDERERRRYRKQMHEILKTPGRAMPLRRLLGSMRYPPDVMVLYAQGYSLSRFLIESSNRRIFLAFVRTGMKGDWDEACKKHYCYLDVEGMEAAWLKWVREERRMQEREASQRRLEKELELLALENQFLQLQLKQERQAVEWKKEQDRLKTKIRRTRRELKQLKEETKPSSSPPVADASSSAAPSTPAKPSGLLLPVFPAPAR